MEFYKKKKFDPLELQWKPSFPESHQVRSRPINPKLWETAKKEFERLCKYNYQPSISPWASPLVTASKATPPFVRFCGDYQWLNPHLVMPQAYIPRESQYIQHIHGHRCDQCIPSIPFGAFNKSEACHPDTVGVSGAEGLARGSVSS